MKIAPKRIRGMLYNGGTSQICTLFIAIVLTPQSGIYIHTYTHIYIKLHIHIHTASKLNRKITRWREQETSTDFQKLFWSHHLKWSLHPLKRTHISETEERMNANVSHLQLQPSKLQKPLKWTSLRTVEAAILYPCSHQQHDDQGVRESTETEASSRSQWWQIWCIGRLEEPRNCDRSVFLFGLNMPYWST